MMLVVADTSPVRYLVLVGAIDCLPKLYDAVVIPPAVRAELAHFRGDEQLFIDALARLENK
jgi:predicted nucleic acid-binding protein